MIPFKLRTILLCLMMMIIVCLACANDTHRVEIIEQSLNSIKLRVTIQSFDEKTVMIEGKNYSVLSLPGEGNSMQKGMPDLPYISRSFIVPHSKMVKTRILDTQSRDYPMQIAPSKGIIFRNQDIADVPYSFDPFYSSVASYPTELSELSEPFIVRDLRGISLYIKAFVYEPSRKNLKVYHSMDILLEYFEDSHPTNALESEPLHIAREFEDIYSNLFLNYDPSRYASVNEVGRLLVITHANFANGIQNYMNWKRQKGIVTEVVQMSSIGTTAAQLKTYVQNYYNQNPSLVFVQLVGDSQHIPYATHSWQSYTGAADPDLSLVAGNDNYPDIFIGRFSCESESDLQTQINRSITYERDMQNGSTWLQRAMGIASNEGGGGQGDNNESDEQHMNIIRNNLLTYGYSSVDQIHESAGATATQISTNINSGRSYINYVGHGLTDRWGTTGFNNNNVNALNNQNQLPFIVSVACLNGNFVNHTSFAETWLRARIANNPTGAVAFYGSSISQPWNPPMRAQDEIVRLLTNNLKSSIGGLFYNGSCRMIEVYGTTNGGVASFRTWHIFGDVSLQVRTKNPTVMSPQYNQTLALNATSYTVNTGVPGALASLSYQNQILGSGYANSSGIATFPITVPAALAEMTITITAPNRVTHIGTVQSIPGNEAFVLIDQFTYIDTNNSIPEIGENGSFDILVRNIGSVNATNLLLILSSADPGVQISSSQIQIASLAAQASISIPTAFSFILPQNSINQFYLPFIVNITSNGGAWTTSYQLLINAPTLVLGDLNIEDVSANNNRRLDPGESVILRKKILNTGNFISSAGSLQISSSSPYLTIANSSAVIPAIPAGSFVEAVFSLTVSPNAPTPSVVRINYSLVAGAYNQSAVEDLDVGLIVEDFESANFASFPWQFGGSQAWQITNASVYSGTYCGRSGNIGHNQASIMQIAMNVESAGYISFFRKVSSDLYYDKLNFYIDNVLQGSWHGEVNWSKVEVAVNAGIRTFKWEYAKDVGISAGMDCAWVDEIVFPPSVPLSNYNPPRNLIAIQNGVGIDISWQMPISGIPQSYQVYRNDILYATVNATHYRDIGVSIGNSFIYKVRAAYSGGMSAFSNSVQVQILSAATLDVSASRIIKAYPIAGQYNTPISISNTGGLNLTWNMALIEPGSSRNVSGSTLSCNPSAFIPGELNILALSLRNMSPDGEYLAGLQLMLPDGFAFVSSTPFIGGSGGNLILSNTVGQNLSWTTDDPLGWGVISPGETATATLQILIDPSVSGNRYLPYTIIGEGWGSAPHSVSDQIELENHSGFWLSLSETQGYTLPGATSTINLNINSHIAPVGIHLFELQISSNDPDTPILLIPLYIRIYEELSWLQISNLQISYTSQGINLSWDDISEASAYRIYHSSGIDGFEPLQTIPPESSFYHNNPARQGFYKVQAIIEEEQ